ncbi:MAG: phosphoribosylglycinamide formyltransferase [Lentihominibacter sp.]|nr:phosphoribosylglycinamide formyltransferase [Lentihominibacter sp.]
MVKTRIAVFISGNGTNLQALIDAQKSGILRHGRIELVISSNSIAHGLKRAEKAGIPTAVVTRKQHKTVEEFEGALLAELEKHDIELIVLAGFMKILSEDFVSRYPERIINVHPSLIPAFCGKGYYGIKVHEAALASGVKVSGATVHFVNEVPDGGRIIMQKAVRVRKDDTPAALQKRIMKEAEWQILPKAVEEVSRSLAFDKKADPGRKPVPDIGSLIEGNSYVGRGIVIGRTPTTGKAVTAYFIMGRSENSRNRVFSLDGEELYTRPYDESKVEDPSLIIYAAMRRSGNRLIVTNGDQTDTIWNFLEKGGTFEEALETRTFEPDYPNFTPRISGMVTFEGDDFAYKLSILKSLDEKGNRTGRFFYSYKSDPGKGHFIHTYEGDGNPLPTFEGEPCRIATDDRIDVFTDELWSSLDEDNKISLYVRYTDPETGTYEDRMINKMER